MYWRYAQNRRISGVVDIMVGDADDTVLAIAELKRDGQVGLYQLLAAMETAFSLKSGILVSQCTGIESTISQTQCIFIFFT